MKEKKFEYYIYLLAQRHGKDRLGKYGITRQSTVERRVTTIEWYDKRKYSIIGVTKLELTTSEALYIESTMRKMFEYNGFTQLQNDHFKTDYNRLKYFNNIPLKIYNKAIVKALNDLQQDDEWAI